MSCQAGCFRIQSFRPKGKHSLCICYPTLRSKRCTTVGISSSGKIITDDSRGTPCSPNSPAGTLIPSLLCPSDNPAEKVKFYNSPNGAAGMTYQGWYAVTSYAGNHGTKNYYPADSPTGPQSRDDGLFYIWSPPGSTFGLCYTRPTPTACVRHEKGVAIKSVTDGLSKTLMFGEKYNEDSNFDAIPSQYRHDALIHEFSYWGWTGNFRATAHAGRSSGDYLQVINRQWPASWPVLAIILARTNGS